MRGIYQWTVSRPDGSALVYVGQAVIVERRQAEYIGGWGKPEDKDPNNIPLRRAVLKYGPAAVKFDILEMDVPVEELAARERYWFWRRVEELGRRSVLNCVEPGVNPVLTPEGREAQLAGIARRSDNQQWRDSLSEAMRRRRVEPYPALRSPEGVVYEDIEDLSVFAETHNLTQSSLCRLVNGKAKSHRGWTIK